ncbi:MAG: hypothetical protein ACFFDN_00085 [Candidatus Hodarchaeota archaeon]
MSEKARKSFEIKYNEEAVKEAKTRLLLKEIEQVFDRYHWKDDIEKGLKEIGFYKWFEDRDDQLWGLKKEPQNILIFISWIDCEAWIYFRIKKQNLR